MDTKRASLPDATLHQADPNYIRKLIERAGLSQRAAARLIGIDDRTMRYYTSGDRELPYAAQYCLEVLARGGVADAPATTSAWFNTRQRPLREIDAGKLVVGRTGADWIVGRVLSDGFGVKIERLPASGVDGGTVGASALSDYVLLDDPSDAPIT